MQLPPNEFLLVASGNDIMSEGEYFINLMKLDFLTIIRK